LANVTLPSLGESVTEGIITQWFKKVGDVVARDEALFEVSTDKVDSEMPSPFAGVLTQISAQEGDTVQTGAIVCVIDENATAGSVAATPAPEAPAPVAETPAPTPAAPAPAPASAPVASTPVTSQSAGPGVVASPVVRRILLDGGIDPSSVNGSGPGGSITRRDAERAVLQGGETEAAFPVSSGRKRMAEHMVVSAQSTPHGFVAIEVDADIFEKLAKKGRESKDGITITDEMVVGLAAVRALSDFEYLNATFQGEEIVVHRTVSLGFVRSLDEDGMLVPVVHAAGGLTLRALARRVSELDQRLSERQMTADDLMGGTFTLMRSPSPHTLYTAPIIIQPQVAVLSIGSVREVPVVAKKKKKKVSIEIGYRIVLGLSFDHRVCEPVLAAAYLERVAELLAGMDLESER
jgi:2-oxoglutarate dehydrogenase E2 component (dihydrolipoamide succinyltransferase)